MSCIFCKIIKKEIPAETIFKNEKILALKDIKPVAPIHFLVIPKKHIVSVNYLKKEDRELIGELFLVAKKLAEKFKIKKNGYRLILNVGKDAGQTVDHLHLHILGGKKLPWA